MVLEKKSIGMCILLSVITCGIYSLYWVYTLQEDTNRLTMNNTEPTGGMVVLLDIVTCGIYGVYWSYRQGEKIDRYYASRGDSTNTNLGLLYLCLFIASYFVGFGILIGLALMQDKVNCMIDERSGYIRTGRTELPGRMTAVIWVIIVSYLAFGIWRNLV